MNGHGHMIILGTRAEVSFIQSHITIRAEIHQALLSQFSLLAEFFIGKLTIEN